MKHAFAVRMALGDPAVPPPNATHYDVPALLADLANASFVESLRAAINDTGVLDTGAYGGRWNPLDLGGTPARDAGTSHISIVDAEGNAVSLTTTINLVGAGWCCGPQAWRAAITAAPPSLRCSCLPETAPSMVGCLLAAKLSHPHLPPPPVPACVPAHVCLGNVVTQNAARHTHTRSGIRGHADVSKHGHTA